MKLKIGRKFVGNDCRAFLIAEIGSNHNQDFALALKHIDFAYKAGVDAVKFQTFKADKHISKYAEIPAKYLDGHKNVHALIKSVELNRDWQKPLKEYAESKGLIFLSSPCDNEAVDQLEKLGVLAHKIASFDLPDLDLVRYIAKTNKPILISTGLADWGDIQHAVNVCREEKNNQIILLQCTSLYPAPASLSNLRAMRTMRDAFNVIVGYSDHTLGDNIPVTAVAMGASVIEKHVTLDKNLPGPDHAFAIEPDELGVMVEKIREIESAFGDGSKNGPRNEEIDMYQYRRSLHAISDIKAGEIITEAMLYAKRPNFGIPVYLKPHIIGRIAKKNIKKDQWVSWDLV